MKRLTIVVILLVLAVCGALGIIALNQRSMSPKYTGPPARVSIGTSLFDSSGLIWIAENQGFFSQNGLDATIRIFDAGKYAVRSLLDGDIDVATAADFVFAVNVMNGEKIQTIGSIGKSQFHFLIARKDRGIGAVSDLKGKRIGLTLRTSAEFFLGRYLQLHDIGVNDVTLVDLSPQQVGESLTNEDVDAVLIWDPYAYPIEKNLGENAFVKPVQSAQMMYWLLICRNDYVTGHPEVIDRLLRAFDQAEKFAIHSPDKTRKILQNRLNLEDGYVNRAWENSKWGLSLDQGLIIAMEDESRWMIEFNRINNNKMPNYLDHIYWQGLERVNPESVTIIH